MICSLHHVQRLLNDLSGSEPARLLELLVDRQQRRSMWRLPSRVFADLLRKEALS